MIYFQDDFFRKMVLSAALLGMVSSLAIAQDQAAPRPPDAQQMPVPLPAPQDPSGGELRLPPGHPPRGADFRPGSGSRRSESLVQMPGVVGRYLFFVLYAPRGEIRGAVLEDGSQFLIPVRPAESNQFGLQAGASVDLKGYGTSNAFGTCLEATELSVNGGSAMILYGAN